MSCPSALYWVSFVAARFGLVAAFLTLNPDRIGTEVLRLLYPVVGAERNTLALVLAMDFAAVFPIRSDCCGHNCPLRFVGEQWQR